MVVAADDPEGGSGGGTVVAEGSPEEVAAVDGSHTGRFLRPLLGGRSSLNDIVGYILSIFGVFLPSGPA